MGQSVAGLSGGSLLLMISTINRAVATGAGDGVHRYGPNFLYLFGRYSYLLAARAMSQKDIGIIGVSAFVIMGYSLVTGIRAMFQKEK